jgi:hypothetical protein
MKKECKPIAIRTVLKNNGKIHHVAFYSHADRKEHILPIEDFKSAFGYSEEEILTGDLT